MVSDNTKVQDGTMNATGTNNATVEFDARKANKGIFADFDRAVDTINRYLKSKGVEGEAEGCKHEDTKLAEIIITLENIDDFKTVEHEIKAQLKMRRQQMTAYNVALYLAFESEENQEEWIWDGFLEFD